MNQGGAGSPATVGTCVNISGICVLDAYNNNTMYFRGIDSGDASILSVALNATNHTIVLTVNVNALAAALPQATTTQKGVGETATDVEAQGKASTTVFLTPSNLAALPASTVFAGFTAYATNAQAITGTSTTLALTPAAFTAAMAANYGTTRVFADQVALSAGVPDFAGQFAAELDTVTPWMSNGTVAGNWLPILMGENTNSLANASVTTIGLGTGASFSFSGSPSTINFSGPHFTILNGGILDLNSAPIYIGGVAQPSSVIINNSFSNASALPIADFISNQNTQTGYTAFTNPATIRTCNTGTVTLQQLAQLVGTLLEDLKAVKLPQT